MNSDFLNIPSSIYEFEFLSNTNDYAKENISKLENGSVIYTPWQISGRGTKGRNWVVEKGDTASFSIILKNIDIKDLPVMPLLCGLSLVKVFEKLNIEGTNIKWPNDVLLDNKKISGILCEAVTLGQKTNIICGIGVNVLTKESFFEKMGLKFAGSILTQTGKKFSNKEVLDLYLASFSEVLSKFKKEGFDKTLKEEYKKSCATLGKDVKVVLNNEEIIATSKDIAYDGRLICENENGEFFVSHGEASVRGLMGYL